MQSKETPPLLHNEDVITGTPSAIEVLMPDTSNSTDETKPCCEAQHEMESEMGNTSVTVYPAVSSGDYDRMVHLKAERELAVKNSIYLTTTMYLALVTNSHLIHLESNQDNFKPKYNGLVYSEVADGGYCKYCVFAQREASFHEFGTLATNILSNHFSSKGHRSHQIAVEKVKAFCNVMRINHLINTVADLGILKGGFHY